MKVIYRLCDIPSTNPPPVYADDKVKLNEVCLKSFLNAFNGIDINIIFILDHCGPSWDEFINNHCEFPNIKIRTNDSINATALLASKLGSEQDEDVLFQECDYLYQPRSGERLIKGLNKFGVVSPYDHPDKYPGEAYLALSGNTHWRHAVSTTQTYAIKNDLLKKNIDIIQKHGYIDHAMWVDLADRGIKLMTPIPAIATHMVDKYLSPNIDWERLW